MKSIQFIGFLMNDVNLGQKPSRKMNSMVNHTDVMVSRRRSVFMADLSCLIDGTVARQNCVTDTRMNRQHTRTNTCGQTDN